MARGRLISRTLGSSRKFAALQKAAGKLAEFSQALYPLLIACSDDFGRQAGDAFTVKLVAFPSSPRKESEFAKAISALASVELIRWYEAQNGQVIEIVDFDAHQTGLHKRTESKFPGFSGKFPEVPSELKRTEQKGRELEQKGTELRERFTEMRTRFERFWESYPKKSGKDAAWAEFQKRNPGDDLTDSMIAAVHEQRASAQWRKDGGQFIPNPRTWLHQGRWQDEPVQTKPTLVTNEAGEDWFDECRRLHQLACNGRYGHSIQMGIDREKAKREAS